jgi:AcrR family transcriptional regulator
VSTPPAGRRPRADAERNRARVLAAARALFAEHGDNVQMADVARAAGVGMGTVYRHFPDRQALILAAAEQRFAEVLEFVRTECLQDADPQRALAGFLRRIGEAVSDDQGLSAALEATMGTTEPRGRTRELYHGVAATLVERARAAGTIRPDSTVADLVLIVHGLVGVIRHRDGDWHRYLELALDGLRTR